MHKAENITENFLRQNELLPSGKKILLAVSGGADSVALLYILDKLFHNDIFIAHVNHQLRGDESLADEEFVKSLAEKFNLPIEVKSVDVKRYAKEKKLSIETAARESRLEALSQIAEGNKCEVIATAHHKNDNTETVIHRMIRGTGFRGLAGIRIKTVIKGKTFIRPLLCLSRQEIEEYLKSKEICWQSDHTNLDVKFTRNRIRHKLIPYLLKDNPNLIDDISSLSSHCAVLTKSIEEISGSVRQKCFLSEDEKQISVDVKMFLQQSAPVQVELIRTALMRLGCGLREYAFEHFKKIIEFAKNAQAGKFLNIPAKVKITKGYDKFFIISQTDTKDKAEAKVLNVPGKTIFAEKEINAEILENIKDEDIKNKDKNTEYFNYAQIKLPLSARPRETGDRFRPFGQNGFKRVGKFLTSEKIDVIARKDVFLIEDADKKVLWVAPVRRSCEAILDSKNLKVVKISIF
ncbi:MAG: tRNA lysidine(34) synthetase TilS [Planctomycetes bacterium GWF2_41_51]|nr:MAG: tRNA lysidine(34) synthetase TilS [Planctomycetes bacterium GWF2_41_51]